RSLHADHVAEEVPPRRLPQRSIHALRVSLVQVDRAARAAQHQWNVILGQTERDAKPLRIALRVERDLADRGLRPQALLATRIIGAVPRALARRVVGWRPEAHELEAVRVMLGIEQAAQLLRAFVRAGASRTDHEQAFEIGRANV